MKDIYFLSGKISSMEKKFIDYENLKKIIQSKTYEEFVNNLQDTFFKLQGISNFDEILKYFEDERRKMIEEIEKIFDENLKLFFLLKYDYFNFANLISGKEFFSNYGILNYYVLKEAFEKNDISKVNKIFYDAFKIIKSYKSVEDKLLLLKIDYYKKIYAIAEKISDDVCKYVKIEIDFANLKTYLNKKMADKKPEIVHFIENGNVKREFFLDDENLWKKISSIYRKINLPLNEENVEIERYKAVIDYIKEGRVKPGKVEKIIFFFIAKEIEIENIQRLAISKFYKQDEEFIKRILIPPYQYKIK